MYALLIFVILFFTILFMGAILLEILFYREEQKLKS